MILDQIDANYLENCPGIMKRCASSPNEQLLVRHCKFYADADRPFGAPWT